MKRMLQLIILLGACFMPFSTFAIDLQSIQYGTAYYNTNYGPNACGSTTSSASTGGPVGPYTWTSGAQPPFYLEQYIINVLKDIAQYKGLPSTDTVTQEHVVAMTAWAYKEAGNIHNTGNDFNIWNMGFLSSYPQLFKGNGNANGTQTAFASFDDGVEGNTIEMNGSNQSRIGTILSDPNSTAEAVLHTIAYYDETPGNKAWAWGNDPGNPAAVLQFNHTDYINSLLSVLGTTRTNYAQEASVEIGPNQEDTAHVPTSDLQYSGGVSNATSPTSGSTSSTTTSGNGCCPNATTTAASGSLDQILQAVALHESGGSPTAGSPGAASGKYQFEPASWQSAAKSYPPAEAYPYASAAPENIQDATAYLWALNAYKKVNGDPFWMAVFWYESGDINLYPDKNAPALTVAPPGNNGLTIASYGNTLTQEIQTGQYNGRPLSSVQLSYTTAPNFQSYLSAAGGAPTANESSVSDPSGTDTTPASATASSAATGCGSGSSNCAVSGAMSTTSGNAAILCEAKKYNGIYYGAGNSHNYTAFRNGCPEASIAQQAASSTASSPGPCQSDCSGLVTVAIDAVFNLQLSWTVGEADGEMSSTDGKNYWQSISLGEVEPGDIATAPGHVEIVDHYDATTNLLYTFGSHKTGTQTSETNPTKGYFTKFFRYTGPGSTPS